MPRPVRRRRFSSQDVEITVIRANFVKGVMWPVPLVQDFLDQVLMLRKSKTNRPFICLPTGVAIYLQLHILLILGPKPLQCLAASVGVVPWTVLADDFGATNV